MSPPPLPAGPTPSPPLPLAAAPPPSPLPAASTTAFSAVGVGDRSAPAALTLIPPAPRGRGAWRAFRAGADLAHSIPTAPSSTGRGRSPLQVNTTLTTAPGTRPTRGAPSASTRRASSTACRGRRARPREPRRRAGGGRQARLDWRASDRSDWVLPVDLPPVRASARGEGAASASAASPSSDPSARLTLVVRGRRRMVPAARPERRAPYRRRVVVGADAEPSPFAGSGPTPTTTRPSASSPARASTSE